MQGLGFKDGGLGVQGRVLYDLKGKQTSDSGIEVRNYQSLKHHRLLGSSLLGSSLDGGSPDGGSQRDRVVPQVKNSRAGCESTCKPIVTHSVLVFQEG